MAILKFSENIAAEYGEMGVLAISAHPCSTKSDMGLKVPKEYSDRFEDTPELASDTIVWLTKERREWLQGRYVDCCWDVLDLEARKDEIVTGDKLKPKLAV